jgi:hypothetical protein
MAGNGRQGHPGRYNNLLYSNLHHVQHQHAYNKPQLYKDIMKLSDHFRGIATASIWARDIVLLWGDVWNARHLMTEFPRLYSMPNIIKSRWPNITATQMCIKTSIPPISQQVAQEVAALNQIVLQTQGSQQDKNKWTYI